MSVFGDGLQTRAFSYIDDVAPLIARAPLVPGAINEVFNVGADTPYTIVELARRGVRGPGPPGPSQPPAGAQRGRSRLFRPHESPIGL